MWTEIWYDVHHQEKVKLGEVTAGHLQHHYAMLQVLSSAVGGKKSSSKGKLVNDMAPKQAVNELNKMFGWN